MSVLAVNGGKKTVPDGLLKQWPIIGDDDVDAVSKSLRSGQIWGANAPETTALSKEWAEFIGVKHALPTNAGTAALHCALAGCNVGPMDEVIVPVYTFYATVSPVLHQGAFPVFVDVDPKTYNIDPAKIESKITEKTKAIIVVHLNGLPADMDEIMAIAEKHNLTVIEDACHSHGAKYRGKMTGSIGHASAFSLNGSKNLPAGEGGLFCTDDDDVMIKGARLGLSVNIEQGTRKYPTYSLGYCHRPSEMQCALARNQLKKLSFHNQWRRRNAEFLAKHLSQIPGIIVPYAPHDRDHIYHLYRLRIDFSKLSIDMPDKELLTRLEKALSAEGVITNQWVPELIPNSGVYQDKSEKNIKFPWTYFFAHSNYSYPPERFKEDYPVAYQMTRDATYLWGVQPPNDEKLLRYYVDGFHKVFENLDEVKDINLS